MNRPLASHCCWIVSRALLVATLVLASVASATVPANFVDELVAGGFQTPTDVEVAPGGRLFVAEKRGRIRIVDNGSVLPVPFIDLTDEVGNVADRGLMSIALDPAFATNGYVYMLYVVDPIFGQPDEGQGNVTFSRLTRYTANGNVANLGSRTILIGATPAEGLPSCYNTHAAGKVTFANDGTMFISAGDGAHADFVDDGTNVASYDPDCEAMFGASQDLGALRAQSDASMDGKVLRVDPATGLGLASNPHYDGDPNSFASRIWVRGFRNPYRFAVRPGSPGEGTLYVGDVGLSTWEEVSVTTASDALAGGKNQGWPCEEGPTPNTTYQLNPTIGPFCAGLPQGALTPPLISWHHSEPGANGFTGSAATAIGFYDGTTFPAQYWGALFFGDFVGNWIRVAFVDANDQLVAVQSFADGVSSPVDIQYDPDTESLFYVSIITGEVRRIRYSLSNLPPLAIASGTPLGGSAPLQVTFSSDGTFDPDMDPITLEWDFGDGSPTTSVANPVHTYATVGQFTATLTAADDQMNVGQATVDITTQNEPPTVAITFPTDFYGFFDGEIVQLAANANDPEDGTNLSYAWDVRLVHNSHEHPEHFTSTQAVPLPFALDNHGVFGDRFSYVIRVEVTDSVGLTASDEVRAIPSPAPPNQTPIASFTATPSSGDVPLVVNLDASSSSDPDIDLLEFEWDFGDGTGSDEQFTTHIYSQPGIYAVTLTVTDVLGAASQVTQPVLVRLPGLVALYDFSEGAGSTVFDISGVGTPLDLTIDDPGNVTWLVGGGLRIDTPTAIRSTTAATKVYDASIASEEFSMEAWVEAANLTQVGPARIVEMAQDPFPNGGNFTLGQVADTWDGRLRTTVTDDFGQPSLLLPPAVGTTALAHLVFTRDTAGATSFYIDGVRQGIATARGTLGSWSNAYELVVGNAPTSDRPWLGAVHKVALYSAALDEVEVGLSFAAGPGLTAAAPLIVAPPDDQLALAGATATFDVAAVGSGPLAYQWQIWNGSSWDDIPGATASSYTTPVLTLGDDGALHRCVVSNALGTSISSQASLSVVTSIAPAMSLLVTPATVVVSAGQDAMFDLDVSNTGNVDLVSVVLDAPDCTTLVGPIGDANLDGRIQTSETWSYGCTVGSVAFQQVVPIRIDAEALDASPAFAEGVGAIELSGAPQRATSGLVVLYAFDEGTGSDVYDISGVGTPFDLSVATPSNTSWPLGGGLSVDAATVVTQAGAATKIINALQASQAVTLEAWVRPENANQFGPARIAVLSEDPFPNGGNFLLGQSNTQYDARLRTTSTDDFGQPGLDTGAGAGSAGALAHLVYTRNATGSDALYLDGALVDSGTKTGNFSNWGPAHEFALANEPTVDRAWLGVLYLFAIYDRDLAVSAIGDHYLAGPQGAASQATAPQITAQPFDAFEMPGETATFDLAAVGTAPISYQWQVWTGAAWQNIAGATSNSYTTPTLSLLDHGTRYRCEASNLLGSAQSEEAEVHVSQSFLVGMHLEVSPTTQQVASGQDADVDLVIENTGNVDVGSLTVSAPACDVLSGPSGDDGDGVLQPVETWTYDCTVSAVDFQQVVTVSVDGMGLEGTSLAQEGYANVALSGAPTRADTGLVVLYRFNEGSGSAVLDLSGNGTPFDLSIETPANTRWLPWGGLSLDAATVVTQSGPATKVINAVTATDAISFEAWVRPANTTQLGPARIAALSQDPFPNGGNFLLGQTAGDYDARLRTTSTNDFGTPGLSAAGAASGQGLVHLVYTREAGGAEVFYVDGAVADTGTRNGTFASWGTGYELAIGNEPTVDREWLGELQLFAIYDRALSGSEVTQNRQAGLQAPLAPGVPSASVFMRLVLIALLPATAWIATRRR